MCSALLHCKRKKVEEQYVQFAFKERGVGGVGRTKPGSLLLVYKISIMPGCPIFVSSPNLPNPLA